MADITLEKNHALLEKLAEYVMNKIPQIETELAKIDEVNSVEITDVRRAFG